MSERKPLCILAVDPSVSLSRADRDRLRRAGVVVIHAAPDKVPALDPAPILQPRVVSSEAFLRAAVETLNANWNFVNGDKLRSISESSYSIPHFAPRPKTPMSSPSSPSLAVGMRCEWFDVPVTLIRKIGRGYFWTVETYTGSRLNVSADNLRPLDLSEER
jgi:hypothetical protein